MFFVAHSDPVKPRSKLCGLNFVCCLSMNILQGFIGRWEDNMFKKKSIVLNIFKAHNDQTLESEPYSGKIYWIFWGFFLYS